MNRVIFRGEEMIGEAPDKSSQILRKTGPDSPPYVAPFHGTKGSTLPSSSVHSPEKVMFGHAFSLQADPAGRANVAPWDSFSLNTRRKSLPTAVRGNSFTKTTSRGNLYLAILSLQCSINSPEVAVRPGFNTTKALAIWPRSSSGTPITPTSATAGCMARVASISSGPIRYAELLITSSSRETNQK